MKPRKKPEEAIVFSQLICDRDYIHRNQTRVPLPRTLGYRVLIRLPRKSKPLLWIKALHWEGMHRKDAISCMKEAARYTAKWQRSVGRKVIRAELPPIEFFGEPPRRRPQGKNLIDHDP